jgi:uncharacterized protein (DUF2342 family)
MDEKLIQNLIQLKLRYFGSRYFSVKNWITFNEITLPDGIDADALSDWEEEKQKYLSKEKVDLEGIKSNYESVLIDRLDSSAAIQEKIMLNLTLVSETKDLEKIAKTMEKVAKLQDEAMAILKVDAYRSDLYEKNKTSIENLMKEQLETF